MAKLRCVFYDPEALDEESRLSERALEACERAGVEVYALSGDGEVEHEGELRSIEFVMRAHAYAPEECIGVGAALQDAPVPPSGWARSSSRCAASTCAWPRTTSSSTARS